MCTCVFSVLEVVPTARLELGALDNVCEREDDVRTQPCIDVLGQEFPGVRTVLGVAAVVAEQIRVRPTCHRTQTTVESPVIA